MILKQKIFRILCLLKVKKCSCQDKKYPSSFTQGFLSHWPGMYYLSYESNVNHGDVRVYQSRFFAVQYMGHLCKCGRFRDVTWYPVVKNEYNPVFFTPEELEQTMLKEKEGNS